MKPVAVLIPTLRRPDSLARTLRSVLAQTDAMNFVREVVVADNDPDGSARAVVEALQGGSTPLVYVHAPVPGVATARNVALGATEASLIAFIDDDEEAEPGWLSNLVDIQVRYDADVVFGPIRGRLPDDRHWARRHLEALFSRTGPAKSGLTEQTWGCGNSLMRRSTALPGPTPFETRADQTGGEDDILFEALKARRGRFAWAADAWVVEHAPAHRATMAYALRRAFAYGQSPCQAAARRKDRLGLARWMAVGAVQFAVFSSVSVGLWLIRRPERAAWMDRSARGLGKLFWFERFEPRFYGQAALRNAAAG